MLTSSRMAIGVLLRSTRDVVAMTRHTPRLASSSFRHVASDVTRNVQTTSEYLGNDKTDDSGIRFTVEDTSSPDGMLEKILNELKTRGTTFIAPGKESPAREDATSALQTLVVRGVNPEYVIKSCVENAVLLRCLVSNPRQSVEILDSLVRAAYLPYEDAMLILGQWSSELFSVGHDGIFERVAVLSACGISAPHQLSSAIRRCPALLFARKPTEMHMLAEAIGGFFSRRQASAMIGRCPQILLKPIEEIEEKYEYVFYQMGIEAEELSNCKSSWIDEMSLKDIEDRHKFMVLTGKYATPDAKRPQIRAENARLTDALDTSDNQFATQVAGVSPEEWIVYKALTTKQKEHEKKNRPFERIKPSKRKAYERRYKEKKDVDEGVFDSSSESAV